MLNIVVQKRRVATTRNKKHLHFWRQFSASCKQARPTMYHTRKTSFHLWLNCVDSPLVDRDNQNFKIRLILYTSSRQCEATWFFTLQRLYWVVSRLWTRFSYPDCQRSRPITDNKFLKNCSGSLDLVAVSKTRLCEQQSCASCNYPNQEGSMDTRDKVMSNVGEQDMDTSGYQVSYLDDIEFYWEKDQLNVDAVFRPGNDTRFSPKRLTTWRWRDQQETPFYSTMRRTRRTHLQQHSLWETNSAPWIAENLSIRNRNRKCSRLCLYEVVSKINTLYVFWKTQQSYSLQEEVNIFKRKHGFLVTSLGDFLKTFDQASEG